MEKINFYESEKLELNISKFTNSENHIIYKITKHNKIDGSNETQFKKEYSQAIKLFKEIIELE